jgi:hypothetical protein
VARECLRGAKFEGEILMVGRVCVTVWRSAGDGVGLAIDEAAKGFLEN